MAHPMRRASLFAATLSSGLAGAPAIAEPVVGTIGACMEDRWLEDNSTFLQCTANDITVVSLSADQVYDDCDSYGDMATIQLLANVSCVSVFRYDVGIYVSLDGISALNGSCLVALLSAPPHLDLDADACGDAVSGETPVTLPSVTVTCLDLDLDGLVDLAYCLSWRGEGDNEVCSSPADAFPGSRSSCHCARVNVTALPVPSTLEIRAQSQPPSDPGRFDLFLDTTLVASAVGDLGSSGPLQLGPGTHTVGEEAASATDLDDYFTSILCLDHVGRCTGDTGLRCFAGGSICADQAAGECDMAPIQVAGCTSCSSVEVEVPVEPSAIDCTITNTRIASEQIVIAVETDPPGEGQTFEFAASYDLDGFILGHGEQNSSGELAPGTHVVTESIPDGWVLQEATCTDGSDPSAIDLDTEEGVTCVFVNRKTRLFVGDFESPDGVCAWSSAVGGPDC